MRQHVPRSTVLGPCIGGVFVLIFLFFGLYSHAQNHAIKPTITNKTQLESGNRNATVFRDSSGKWIVAMDGREGSGIAWIKSIEFDKGVIELDVKGRDLQQQSFVGVAFHGTDTTVYEAVYFRPFNFRAVDSARKHHMVQYIHPPAFDWQVLRQKFPGVYESGIMNPPDPNGWFHAKIIVSSDSIRVFVNHERVPSLVVAPLAAPRIGQIGFWVGNGSEGNFCNLSFLPD